MSDRSPSPGKSPAALSPRPGLFSASIQGEGVVLDLVGDRYWGLEGPAATIWQGWTAGLDDAEVARRLVAEHGLDRARAEALLPRQLEAWAKAGLWVPASSRAHREVFRSKPPGTPPARSLSREHGVSRASLGPSWRLLRAAFWSRRTLRARGLAALLEELGSAPRRRSPEIDWQAVARIVTTFRTFRRLFVRQRDCLTRSLLLARALQLEGLPSDLCFGARKIPFRAHAWVEVDRVALLDPVEELRRFTVIARF